jgi:hypothetical protein
MMCSRFLNSDALYWNEVARGMCRLRCSKLLTEIAGMVYCGLID